MRTVRWGRWWAALVLGALWWWGVLRLALAPDAGPVEAAVAAGGWGLSLLPVHCAPGRLKARKGKAAEAAGTGGAAARLVRAAGAGAEEQRDPRD
jgi:hypothetical protein